MDEVYEITFAGAPVGTAQIEKQGLYYRFSCRCRLPEEGFFRIHVICADKREDLGICVPMDGMFGMDKRLPAVRLCEDNLEFVLLPKEWKPQLPVVEQEQILITEEKQEFENMGESDEGIFVPVCEDKPFEYLDKLENARMEIRDNLSGVVITE